MSRIAYASSPVAPAHEASPDEGPRLTERERLVWLEHRLGPDVPTNVMLARFEVDGPVDPARLTRAVRGLVEQNPSLRTVVAESGDGAPRPVLLRPWQVAVPLVDLSRAPVPDAAFDAWLAARAPLPFALDRPLFEAFLVRLGASRHVVVLRQHHLITDAESHALIWKQITELYAGRPTEALRPMAEHRAAERRYRASELAVRDKAYWDRVVESAPPTPTFYGRAPRERTGRLRRVEVSLDPRRAALLDAARRDGPYAMRSRAMSEHALFCTALCAWLWRVTGERRLAIGCPLANRRSRRVRRVVGMVMEQSPMLVDVREGDTFAALFERTRAALEDLLRHGRACVSNPTQRKLYDAVFNLHRVTYAPLDGQPVRGSIAPGLAWCERWPEGVPDGGEAFSLTVYDRGGVPTLAFDLNRDVFDDGAASRAVEHFGRVLDAALEDPEARPADVDLLTDPERAICAAPPPEITDRRTFLDDVWATPEDRVVLRAAGRDVRHGELLRRAGSIARALDARGVGRGDAVAVALRRTPDLVAGLLAVSTVGAAYVPLDPRHPEARTRCVVEDAQPALLLTDGCLTLDLPTLDVGAVEDDDPLAPRAAPDDLAYVLFTSGSTGRPKGVEIRHRSIAAFLRSMLHVPGLSAHDRVLALATPGFDISTFELFAPLMIGATVVLADEETVVDSARLRALVEDEGVTVIQATPPSFRMLIDAGWRGRPDLTAMCGGEPMAPDLARALLERSGSLWNVYGPTESTVWCTAHRVTEALSPMPVGRPVEYAAIRVIGPGGRPAPIGVVGEIAVAGGGVGRGYRRRPELTSAQFVPDVVDPSARMYRSGDLGRWRPDGALECLGREDGQVKIRGHRVELGEIEAALRAHPAVSDAAVLLEGGGAHAALVAHVAAPGAQVAELAEHARQRLPGYMVPSRWSMHESLPLGPTGKIDRRALSEVGQRTVASLEQSVAPRDDVEAVVAGVWAEALGIPRVGVTDDFFDLGGHSLAAAQIVETLRRSFAVELSLGALFEARTVERLARQLRDGDVRGACEVVTLAHGGDRAPLFCICGLKVYQPLAVRLGIERSIYGVYLAQEEDVLRMAREGQRADLSIPAMAEAYTEVILQKRPRGPYALAGLSFGGVLAYEIAQRLRALGHDVPLLALLDTVIPRGVERAPMRWLAAQLRGVRRAPLAELRRYAKRATGRTDEARVADVREQAYVAAMKRYEPQPYDGEVVLFRASESGFGEGYVAVRDGGLGEFAPRMRIVDVPGQHIGIMHPPHVDTLSAKLRPFLQRLP